MILALVSKLEINYITTEKYVICNWYIPITYSHITVYKNIKKKIKFFLNKVSQFQICSLKFIFKQL